MPTSNKLTDAVCRRAEPRARAYKLFDGLGLALVVLPSGVRSWRLFYRFGGQQRTMVFGQYPEVTLAEARRLRDAARATLRAGDDPMADRHRKPAPTMTLKAASDAYWQGRQDVTPGYRANAERGLAMHILPALGALPVRSITRAQVLEALTLLDAKGRHVYVRRVRVWLGQVLAWCVEHGHAEANVCASIDPRRAFARAIVEHHAAVPLAEVPELLQRLAMERELQSVLACWLIALTWLRTGEVRGLLWADVERDVIRIPAGRMKRRREHLVPLSDAARAVLVKLKARAGTSAYVLPAEHRPDRPISENAVLYLLARIGYGGRMSGHGWRTVASTWANEAGYSPDAIERQLAHAPDDRVRSAYNAAQYMPERIRMMQAWAEWLAAAESQPPPA